MAKLFIFAIGGSGARVVKALTMLLAAGVKINNTEKIIPIIIDPDIANGDLTRTEEIIGLYRSIHKKSSSSSSSFFEIPLCSLDEVKENATAATSDHFRYEIEGVKDHTFKDFIDYGDMDRSNHALASLLFSKDNLHANMDVGFKGNPNIGSVVLNKFRNSDLFSEFAQSLGEKDRVFIISSIFGGTGAAGFPIILKNIRGAQSSTPNYLRLQNAKIGAITMLPYFSINDTDKKTIIDSNTFISKTKAALNYYAQNVSKSMNALYYIGDEFADNRVNGADGSSLQKNRAHFIEMASALAIIDFMAMKDDELSTPQFFEYGLREETNKIEFKHLGTKSHDLLARPLTQFTLFEIFFKNYFDSTIEKVYATNGNHKLQRAMLDRRFNGDLSKFNTHFEQWLTEMSESSVAFTAINKNVSQHDILNLVAGSSERVNRINPFERHGLEAYLTELAKTDEKENFDALADSNKKLMATFSHATANVIKKKINL